MAYYKLEKTLVNLCGAGANIKEALFITKKM